jgi:hypothetical protein
MIPWLCVMSYDGFSMGTGSIFRASTTTDWTPGPYQIVLRTENQEEPLAVSRIFVVREQFPDGITISTNQNSYQYGESMVIRWNRTDGKSFQTGDYVQVVRGGDFTIDYNDIQHSLYCYQHRIWTSQWMKIETKISWGFGTFQIALFNRFHQLHTISDKF